MTAPKTDDDLYWDQVDAFLEQANNACDNADPGVVAAALLNAAARFNAFVVAHASLDKKEFADDVEGTTHFISGRFRDQLKAHMEDYRDHYAELIGTREHPEG
ncbi:DUF3144 domain-containing protein [Cellvibrio japonicus]|uniref:DUF3144 domain-containing protein n=1 Tax=Cellvibrio japonicus (strain Ueda107) TaxID=498211 RepID=B3PDW2_CELJU|nr:DUF3144 domain-containing protein [Cellvibrio japonicus]ACE84711.1 hypothetical protein CJA_3165 [Cellvibrio japonicus Ueda107]QEI13447.1 DUF3144 domain-containing protein [Cellvibrio japonicus]QEI17021.1 DUF3144 domain-containing protein [Cellvibrio japonicus]QEI20599.1 DUF3144 domain-containing protein [Cellvibrio japonicus]